MKHIIILIMVLCLCAGCINNDIDPLISGGNEYASYVWTIQDTLQRITVSLNPDSLQYREWAFDYGTAEDSKEMFEYLKGYSPLHNLKPNTAYPATMVTTADHDDRVVPAHSFKFAATLQNANTGRNPVLIRIETDAGHGAGTPISKAIEQAADRYSFAWHNMGVIPDIAKKDM